jgi:hypothetical protein
MAPHTFCSDSLDWVLISGRPSSDLVSNSSQGGPELLQDSLPECAQIIGRACVRRTASSENSTRTNHCGHLRRMPRIIGKRSAARDPWQRTRTTTNLHRTARDGGQNSSPLDR